MANLLEEMTAGLLKALVGGLNAVTEDRGNSHAINAARTTARLDYARLMDRLKAANHRAGLTQLQDFVDARDALADACKVTFDSSSLETERFRILTDSVLGGLVSSFNRQLDMLEAARMIDVKTASAELAQSVVDGMEPGERALALRTQLAMVSEANEQVMTLLQANEQAIGALGSATRGLKTVDRNSFDEVSALISHTEAEIAEAHASASRMQDIDPERLRSLVDQN